jgi:large subunit ribosomal protein L31
MILFWYFRIDCIILQTCFKKQEKFITMKKGIHPENYRLVAFRDMSNGYTFVTRSTTNSKETVKLEDGKEYPLVKLEISNTSHPFYTGKMKLVDTAGRVDKFMNRYKDHLAKKQNK